LTTTDGNDMIWQIVCEIFEVFKMVIVFQVRYFMFGFYSDLPDLPTGIFFSQDI
jgi:hypothetical protein